MTNSSTKKDKVKKKTWIKVLVPIIGIPIVIITVLSIVKSKLGDDAFRTGSHVHQPISEGEIAPDFKLTQFNGPEIRLSELKKEIIFVNFWATWCQACIIEMPSIIKLREKFKQRGLEVLFVNLDEKPERVLPPFLSKLKIDFPVYLDSKNAMVDIFDVHAIPLTAILDKNRKVLWIESGERDWNSVTVHRLIERWLAK